MGRRWRVLLLILLALAPAACGSDTVTAPRKSELVGTWNATKIEFVNQGNPDEKIEIVSTGGSGILTLNDDATFKLIITPYGFDPMITDGTWKLTNAAGNQMVLTYPLDQPQQTVTFDLFVNGQDLKLTNGTLVAGWDFTGDGILDPATLNMIFVRAH